MDKEKMIEQATEHVIGMGICSHCHKNSISLYEFKDRKSCAECIRELITIDVLNRKIMKEKETWETHVWNRNKFPSEDIPIMEELMDMDHVAKPDLMKHVAIEQPDGSAFITDNVQAEMTCKCGKSKMWMHAGQISTPCPYCRRVWLAVHQRKTGNFKFIHYNAWWRTLWYKMIGRSPL